MHGLKLVIDCANGAAYKVAPRVLADLGAEIVPIGCSPNGRNINDGCGSTEPGLLQLTVPGVRADAGIALDGDGDRLSWSITWAAAVDGDQLLYVLARRAQRGRRAEGPGGRHGDEQPRASRWRSRSSACLSGAPRSATATCCSCCATHGGVLGGETSGHLLCLDKTTTGDGLIVRAAGAGRHEVDRQDPGGARGRHAEVSRRS